MNNELQHIVNIMNSHVTYKHTYIRVIIIVISIDLCSVTHLHTKTHEYLLTLPCMHIIYGMVYVLDTSTSVEGHTHTQYPHNNINNNNHDYYYHYR